MPGNRPYLSLALYFADQPGDLVLFRDGGKMISGRFAERIPLHPEDIMVITDRKGENPRRIRQTHVYKYPRSGQTQDR